MQALPAWPSLQQALSAAAAAAAVAASAAAAPPLWFCFVCPVVLGLLAPLVINYGLGEAATAACDAWKLDDQACVDLFVTALGVGLFLSLMSAWPIFRVCRMYECSHRPPPQAR